MKTSVPLKQCSRKDKCLNPLGCHLPATSEYFNRCKSSGDGFQCACKVCQNQASAKYRADHLEEMREASRRWGAEHPDKRRASVQKWRGSHIEEARARDKKRYAKHPEKRRASSYNSRAKKPEKYRALSSSSARTWAKTHPANTLVYKLRRRSKVRGLPFDFSKEKAVRMFVYWDYRCAVCGNMAGLWTALATDHWIPISSSEANNPGTVATNMIPLCHGKKGTPFGIPSCNLSKADKNPEQWLVQYFGKRKANAILERINAYFQWVREQDMEMTS